MTDPTTPDLHDAVTHRKAWVSICSLAIGNADNDADRSYFEHETRSLEAFLDTVTAWNTHPAPAVTVKPLEWSREDDGSMTAESIFGLYCAYRDDGNGWLVMLDGHDDSWAKYPADDYGFGTDALAVEHCEQDYTSRMAPAIRPAPNARAEAAYEMAKLIDEHCIPNAEMDGDQFLVDLLTKALDEHRALIDQPAPAPTPAPHTITPVIAAKNMRFRITQIIEKRLTGLYEEYGSYDPSTNVTEFGDENAEAEVEFLSELTDEIEAILLPDQPAPAPTPQEPFNHSDAPIVLQPPRFDIRIDSDGTLGFFEAPGGAWVSAQDYDALKDTPAHSSPKG